MVELDASGLEAGLPKGQMGNSEVGHLNIGAGRVVFQEYSRINRAIESGEFFRNPAVDLINDDTTPLRASDHDGFVLYIYTGWIRRGRWW